MESRTSDATSNIEFLERRKTDSRGDDPVGHGAGAVPLSELKVYILLPGGRWGGIYPLSGRRWIFGDRL